MITIQYLEPGPHVSEISPFQARKKLQAAFELLPFDCLLVGWDIPPVLENICRDVTGRAGAKLYRWHPLLTGDGTVYPEEKWRTQNIKGQPLEGFQGLPEFTFVCPNHPAAREAILTRATNLAQSSRFEGIFLDRMRFPSPAVDPVNALSCFCEHCQQAGSNFGIDFKELRQVLKSSPNLSILGALSGEKIQHISAFLDFRQDTIVQLISNVTEIIRSFDLEIGLDCFSPSLTRMVGQDLNALAPLADWTKIMIYGHAFGPATLPFELTDLATWLIACEGVGETQALATVAELINVPLPVLLKPLRDDGLLPAALAEECKRGQQMVTRGKLLAGIELVEIPGVSELNVTQIGDDLHAIKAAGADGLSLSWDLWHMPIEWLELVRSVWLSQ